MLQLIIILYGMLGACMFIIIFVILDFLVLGQYHSFLLSRVRSFLFFLVRTMTYGIYNLCVSFHPSATFRCTYCSFVHNCLATLFVKTVGACPSWMDFITLVGCDTVGNIYK